MVPIKPSKRSMLRKEIHEINKKHRNVQKDTEHKDTLSQMTNLNNSSKMAREKHSTMLEENQLAHRDYFTGEE